LAPAFLNQEMSEKIFFFFFFLSEKKFADIEKIFPATEFHFNPTFMAVKAVVGFQCGTLCRSGLPDFS
jgi:hypothetical protein